MQTQDNVDICLVAWNAYMLDIHQIYHFSLVSAIGYHMAKKKYPSGPKLGWIEIKKNNPTMDLL